MYAATPAHATGHDGAYYRIEWTALRVVAGSLLGTPGAATGNCGFLSRPSPRVRPASHEYGGRMQAARLIPVSGISSEKEAEQRAASAVLAVLTIVRDLSIELLAPRGASRAQRATVEAYTEPVYTVDGKRI